MTREVFNKLIDELYVSAKNVLKNKNALYGKKDDPLLSGLLGVCAVCRSKTGFILFKWRALPLR